MKTCSKCSASKALSEFYSRSAQCKSCVIARVKTHRAENVEAVRKYDRERSTLPHRVANATRVSREWRREHRDRLKAHNAAARAGLSSPDMCEGCNQKRRLDKHHHDYSKPLLVVWLCKPCHAIADKIRRRLEAS